MSREMLDKLDRLKAARDLPPEERQKVVDSVDLGEMMLNVFKRGVLADAACFISEKNLEIDQAILILEFAKYSGESMMDSVKHAKKRMKEEE